MRFKLSPDLEHFRGEVRTFMQENIPPGVDWSYGGELSGEGEEAVTRAMQKKLAAKGWLALGWPKEYGGGGADQIKQAVYLEEFSYAQAPAGMMTGVAWVGPALMLYGTDEQKERFLPRITGADDWWCTMYSEPGAGSDLSSLQTRAVRQGDDYVVNGLKIWTSVAHFADWAWLAARTDPEAPKHKGITMFLLDMKTPGISVRPLPNMAGHHGFNQIYLEDVRIPADRVVGEVNRGWYLLAVALDFERSAVANFGAGMRAVDDLLGIATRWFDSGAPATLRMELADRALEMAVGKSLSYRVAWLQTQGVIPNREASMAKLFGSEAGQRIAHTGIRLLGMHGQLRHGSHAQVSDLASKYLSSVSRTIGGGTSEVQRQIIATRGLGLPR